MVKDMTQLRRAESNGDLHNNNTTTKKQNCTQSMKVRKYLVFSGMKRKKKLQIFHCLRSNRVHEPIGHTQNQIQYKMQFPISHTKKKKIGRKQKKITNQATMYTEKKDPTIEYTVCHEKRHPKHIIICDTMGKWSI